MLAEGAKMPRITVLDDTGKTVNTGALTGKPLVLWFYPKDDTPGWTNEASQFRDAYARFKRKGVEVVGVSRDSVASHQKFKTKYDIPFTLLADVDAKLCDAFGVIVEKNMYGKITKGVARSTFLIDPSGVVRKVWPKVSVEGHAEEVYASLD